MKVLSYIGIYGNTFNAVVALYTHNVALTLIDVGLVLISLWLLEYWRNYEVKYLTNSLGGN